MGERQVELEETREEVKQKEKKIGKLQEGLDKKKKGYLDVIAEESA